MNDLKILQDAEYTAQQNQWQIERAYNVAVDAANSAVLAEWRDRRAEASRAVQAAETALREAQSEAASHEWEGRKVFRMEAQSSRWAKRPDKAVYGTVEVRRIGTAFAVNISGWRMPNMGDAFVRLAKADGKPGIKFERLNNFAGTSEWKLVEDAK